jgi:hypothetical protein
MKAELIDLIIVRHSATLVNPEHTCKAFLDFLQRR